MNHRLVLFGRSCQRLLAEGDTLRQGQLEVPQIPALVADQVCSVAQHAEAEDAAEGVEVNDPVAVVRLGLLGPDFFDQVSGSGVEEKRKPVSNEGQDFPGLEGQVLELVETSGFESRKLATSGFVVDDEELHLVAVAEQRQGAKLVVVATRKDVFERLFRFEDVHLTSGLDVDAADQRGLLVRVGDAVDAAGGVAQRTETR